MTSRAARSTRLTPPVAVVLGLCAGALLSTAVAAQQTLIVGAGGSFATIQSAVDAAAPGDTVLVLAGVYQESLDIDKGIQLVGQGALLERPAFALFPFLVHDLPASQAFTMVGFGIEDSGAVGDLSMEFEDCLGPVVLRELRQGLLARWSLRVTNVGRCHVGSCDLHAVFTVDSHSVFEDCLFDPSIIGLNASGGRTVLVRCTVSDGNHPFAGPGIGLQSGVLELTRTDVFAAAGSFSAIQTTGGTVLLDPSTTLASTGGAPLVGGSGTVTSQEFTSLAAATDGAVLSLAAHGIAGRAFATVLSFPSPEIATPWGLAWVDPATLVLVDAGYFPATRLHTAALPHAPVPSGLVVALQTLCFCPTGWSLSNPSLVAAP